MRKYLYPLTLSKKENSRNSNQVEFVNQLLRKVTRESIAENLYNQNIDPIKILNETNAQINVIFESFNNDKYKILKGLSPFDILIVPEYLLSNWKEEFITNAQILALNEFLKIKSIIESVKRVVFLSLFGNDIQPNDLVEELINSHHEYIFISYCEEAELVLNLKDKFSNDTIGEYISKDRENISGLKYEIIPKVLKVSDIIEDLHTKSLNDKREYQYDETVEVNYLISFEENDEIICDGSKSVLLFANNIWLKSKVSNLRPFDKVRIYNNLSKEMLFDVAAKEDSKGRFNKIDNDSRLWKNALIGNYRKRLNNNRLYSELDFLNDLQRNGLSIINPLTIRKWLNINDKERFPSSDKNLLAIKTTINEEILNVNFESIKKSKKFYRGIMISLGRDLSDEVMDYIVSKSKIGKILLKFTKDEIHAFVQKAAPIRIIKNISVTEEDE